MFRSFERPVTVLKTGVSPSRVIQTGVTWAVPSSLTRPSIPSALPLSKSVFALSLRVMAGLYPEVSGARKRSRSRGIRPASAPASERCTATPRTTAAGTRPNGPSTSSAADAARALAEDQLDHARIALVARDLSRALRWLHGGEVDRAALDLRDRLLG